MASNKLSHISGYSLVQKELANLKTEVRSTWGNPSLLLSSFQTGYFKNAMWGMGANIGPERAATFSKHGKAGAFRALLH